ncbi:glycoside hydrolase family 7 protein [Xylariaceae sp. FL0016]|nr:glycoside hydrolase family 7 protein [Xylariaceae sp. FL0016]
MYTSICSRVLLVAIGAIQTAAQGIGTADSHPSFPTQKCTNAGGCVTQQTSLVLDAGFRELRSSDGTSCGGGGAGAAALNATLCPDGATCAHNCVLDGADYAGSGVAANGSSVTLSQYMVRNGSVASVSPKVYLLDAKAPPNATVATGAGGKKRRSPASRRQQRDVSGEEHSGDGGDKYALLYLKNQEISFDVDVSKLPCGMNGALYLAEMNATGARSALNPAGAAYGTGYCDSQCPVLPFLNGVANTDARGACCTEMDLWEANSLANAFTGHTCTKDGVYGCKDGECGSLGVCDKSGCGYNTYSLGNKTFYGPSRNNTIDTTRPFTVTTQFLTQYGKPDNILNEIRRVYTQDGRVIENAAINSSYYAPGNSIIMAHCQAYSSTFENLGGLKQMGRALDRGMVLVMSLWNDKRQFMNWLDSGDAGPCSRTEGDPKVIMERSQDTRVVFGNVRWGDVGTTYNIGNAL